MTDQNKGIEKTIKEYTGKLETCDILLNFNLESVRKERHSGNKDQDVLTHLTELRIHYSAQRQCYVQIISDLNCILEEGIP